MSPLDSLDGVTIRLEDIRPAGRAIGIVNDIYELIAKKFRERIMKELGYFGVKGVESSVRG
ncbi:hypothetical protein C2G38_2154128 [Gigaspora rosea]|uniref:Uncharacterized protein n=1 Tax=Gigaspora rosea TaxID=44941 RepID=A0A397W5A9_9GLOM|nr:hypothetical protein C2G38_2154128 [Gigaspora rosea]